MTAGKHYLLASDFDQTLSFYDSGQILSEILGVTNFQAKVQGLARRISCSREGSSRI